MRVRHMAIAATATAALLGFTVTPAQADHSWGNYHWARTSVVSVNIYSSVTSDWSGALTTANNDWNKSAFLQNTLVGGDTNRKTRRQCARPSGAIRVCNYAYGNNG